MNNPDFTDFTHTVTITKEDMERSGERTESALLEMLSKATPVLILNWPDGTRDVYRLETPPTT